MLRPDSAALEDKMKRLLASLALALALAGCMTGPTNYQPALVAGDMGYRQTQIETDRYRVSFRAHPDLKAPEVEDLALRRAAEITLGEGYQWFRVVTRHTELVSGDRGGGGPTIGLGGSAGSYGSSLGLGIGFNLAGDTRAYEAELEILLGHGAKPQDIDAYDAQSLLSRPR
jgi:hypothetical protein